MKASKKGPKKPEDPKSQHLELLTESQVMFMHNEISNRMCEIQGGLSNLKQKHPAVASIHPKPVPYSRPVDLLEVYCEKESQITQQINRCGGMRSGLQGKMEILALTKGSTNCGPGWKCTNPNIFG